MSIGIKIKKFVEGNFKSVSAFSAAVGYSRTNIYQYFNDEVQPGAEFFKKLKEFGCDLNWLFSEESANSVNETLHIYGADKIINEKSPIVEQIEQLKEIRDNLNKTIKALEKVLIKI